MYKINAKLSNAKTKAMLTTISYLTKFCVNLRDKNYSDPFVINVSMSLNFSVKHDKVIYCLLQKIYNNC